MPNFWNQQSIPHKEWTLEEVIDVREEGQAEWETDYEICMMCGNEKIRYVHILTHPEVTSTFKVGCTCAEKMTNDYTNPRLKENHLKNKASRRANWFNKNWRTNIKGNSYLKIEGHFLLIYRDSKSKMLRIKIDDTFGKKAFNNLEEAKAAVFEGVEFFKERGKW